MRFYDFVGDFNSAQNIPLIQWSKMTIDNILIQGDQMYLNTLSSGFVVLDPRLQFLSVDDLPKVVCVSCSRNMFSYQICQTIQATKISPTIVTNSNAQNTSNLLVVVEQLTSDLPVVVAQNTNDLPVVVAQNTSDLPVVIAQNTNDLPVVIAQNNSEIPMVVTQNTSDQPVMVAQNTSVEPQEDQSENRL
jgi:hypothetical protein